jgi:hypothetical protein
MKRNAKRATGRGKVPSSISVPSKGDYKQCLELSSKQLPASNLKKAPPALSVNQPSTNNLKKAPSNKGSTNDSFLYSHSQEPTSCTTTPITNNRFLSTQTSAPASNQSSSTRTSTSSTQAIYQVPTTRSSTPSSSARNRVPTTQTTSFTTSHRSSSTRTSTPATIYRVPTTRSSTPSSSARNRFTSNHTSIKMPSQDPSTNTNAPTGSRKKRSKSHENDPVAPLVKPFFDLPGKQIKKDVALPFFQMNERGTYDALKGVATLMNGQMQDSFIKFNNMNVEMVRSIGSKLGLTRLTKKQEMMDAIHSFLKFDSGLKKIVKSTEAKRIDLGRVIIRLIGVVFNKVYRDEYEKLNQKQSRKTMEKGTGDPISDFYNTVSNEILDDTSEMHNDVLPPETSVFREYYEKYMLAEFSLQDDLYPSTPIGNSPAVQKYANGENLKKIIVCLEKVRKDMKAKMSSVSGTNENDPMKFTDAAIGTVKPAIHIPKLAAFYFFYMCDVHKTAAKSNQRDLHPDLVADTVDGVPGNQTRHTKKQKQDTSTESVVTVEKNVLSMLAVSDRIAQQSAIGSQATCTDYMTTMKQEMLQKYQAKRMDLFMAKIDPNHNLSKSDVEYIDKEIADIKSEEAKLNDEIKEYRTRAVALRTKELLMSVSFDEWSNGDDVPHYEHTLNGDGPIRASLNDIQNPASVPTRQGRTTSTSNTVNMAADDDDSDDDYYNRKPAAI